MRAHLRKLDLVTTTSLLMTGIIRIISNLPIDRDLDSSGKATFVIMSDTRFQHHWFRLGLNDARFAIDPVAFGLGAHIIEGISVGSMRGGDVSGDATGAGGDDVCGAGGTRVGGAGEGKRAAMFEAATDGEDDAEGHGGCENCCHAGNWGGVGHLVLEEENGKMRFTW